MNCFKIGNVSSTIRPSSQGKLPSAPGLSEYLQPPTVPRCKSAGPDRLDNGEDTAFTNSPPFMRLKRSKTAVGIRSKTPVTSQPGTDQKTRFDNALLGVDNKMWELGVTKNKLAITSDANKRRVRARSFVLENLNISSISGAKTETEKHQALLDHILGSTSIIQKDDLAGPSFSILHEERTGVGQQLEKIRNKSPKDGKEGYLLNSNSMEMKGIEVFDDDEEHGGLRMDAHLRKDELAPIQNIINKNKSVQYPRAVSDMTSSSQDRIIVGESLEKPKENDISKRRAMMDEILGKVPEKKNPQKVIKSADMLGGTMKYTTQNQRDLKLAATLYKLKREQEGRAALKHNPTVVIPHGKSEPESSIRRAVTMVELPGESCHPIPRSPRGQPEGMAGDQHEVNTDGQAVQEHIRMSALLAPVANTRTTASR